MEITKDEAIRLYKENIRLKEIIEIMQKNNKELEDRLIKCSVTGFFNHNYFKKFFHDEINNILLKDNTQNPALIVVNLDNIGKIFYSYGDDEVERVLKNSAYILKGIKDQKHVIFRLQGALFAYYIPNANKEDMIKLAEDIRNSIANSEKFIEKITASIGVVCFDEIREQNATYDKLDQVMFDIALMRVKYAKKIGMNIVCSDSKMEANQVNEGRILLVDSDEVNILVLSTFLNNIKYEVIIARDGEEALSALEKNQFDLIVSEIMIPKVDGLLLREKLLSKSKYKNIPFIIMSHLKDTDTVERAASLGIEHYFKKPIMISEFIGVVKNKRKENSY